MHGHLASIFNYLATFCTEWLPLLLLQWHVTPQVRSQWQRYSAIIAAAEATPPQQPEATASEPAAGCQPGRPAGTAAADPQPSAKTGPAAAGAQHSHRAAKRHRASISVSSVGQMPRIYSSSSAPSAGCSAAGGGACSSSPDAVNADDRSIVHDTVGCVVVDAKGAAGSAADLLA